MLKLDAETSTSSESDVESVTDECEPSSEQFQTWLEILENSEFNWFTLVEELEKQCFHQNSQTIFRLLDLFYKDLAV